MKLDKTVEPLATGHQADRAQRSALGLKYIQLSPGTAKTTWRAGDTIPLQVRRPAGGVRRPLRHLRPEDT